MEILDKPQRKNFKDLEGKKFNRLRVIGYAGSDKSFQYWWCKCDCGKIKKGNANMLKNGDLQSCGCFHKERNRISKNIKHNLSQSSEYNAFYHAKNRCENPKAKGYKNYGGRGIQFLYDSFEEFLEDVGKKPEPSSEYWIERIDNNKNYEKGNCKWATITKQCRNKRNNIWIDYQNQSMCLQDWSKKIGIRFNTLWYRLNERKWCEKCTLTIPVRGGNCEHR
jgi:hypothetical protein